MRLKLWLIATSFYLSGCGLLMDEIETDGYNYSRFSVEYYDHSSLPGPWAGQRASDVKLTDLSGNVVKLSDHRGKFIVLETASITCPAYRQHVQPMNALRRRYEGEADVVFLVLYVREAHPGKRIGRHMNFAQKLSLARRFDHYVPEETRTILIDDLSGTAHRTYGSMPNMAYVISPDFRILFRSDWTNIEVIENILAHRSGLPIIDAEHHDPGSGSLIASINVLLDGGLGAIWDVVINAPEINAAWSRADAYYQQHGKLKRSSEE
ncbi:MAG: deiodinase-like protein [Pseudomonadota bacterium]